jgi:hypothetical protein
MPTACETKEWLESLDPKCKLEATLAGYHPPSLKHGSISTGDDPFKTVGVFIEYTPHEVIISRETPPRSPSLASIKKQIRRMSSASSDMFFSRPPTPDTPSPYRSPSPDTICCGLITVEKPVKVYV